MNKNRNVCLHRYDQIKTTTCQQFKRRNNLKRSSAGELAMQLRAHRRADWKDSVCNRTHVCFLARRPVEDRVD